MELDEIYAPVKEELERVEARIKSVSEARLDFLLEELGNGLRKAGRVTELASHILASSGKRLRPALTLLSARFFSYNPERLIPMATAIEVLHIATLVHDDAIDNSPLRRGRPTINRLWGDEKAILLGDYLIAQAAELALATGSREVVKRLYQTLMVITSGELAQSFSAFNLEESREHYLHRISSKTASLLSVGAECGAILSRAPARMVRTLKNYGFLTGVAFQIVDDVLDYIGTTEELGKPVGSDLNEGTITLPVLLFTKYYPNELSLSELLENRNRRENTRRVAEIIRNSPEIIQECYDMASRYIEKAKENLKPLPDSPAKKLLEALSEFMVRRRR